MGRVGRRVVEYRGGLAVAEERIEDWLPPPDEWESEVVHLPRVNSEVEVKERPVFFAVE